MSYKSKQMFMQNFNCWRSLCWPESTKSPNRAKNPCVWKNFGPWPFDWSKFHSNPIYYRWEINVWIFFKFYIRPCGVPYVGPDYFLLSKNYSIRFKQSLEKFSTRGILILGTLRWQKKIGTRRIIETRL
jgi:hypothetical protein